MIDVDRNAWALDTLGLSLAAMAHIVAQMACLNEEYLARAGSQHSIVSRIAECVEPLQTLNVANLVRC
jgi:hypothetical protein